MFYWFPLSSLRLVNKLPIYYWKLMAKCLLIKTSHKIYYLVLLKQQMIFRILKRATLPLKWQEFLCEKGQYVKRQRKEKNDVSRMLHFSHINRNNHNQINQCRRNNVRSRFNDNNFHDHFNNSQCNNRTSSNKLLVCNNKGLNQLHHSDLCNSRNLLHHLWDNSSHSSKINKMGHFGQMMLTDNSNHSNSVRHLLIG